MAIKLAADWHKNRPRCRWESSEMETHVCTGGLMYDKGHRKWYDCYVSGTGKLTHLKNKIK